LWGWCVPRQGNFDFSTHIRLEQTKPDGSRYLSNGILVCQYCGRGLCRLAASRYLPALLREELADPTYWPDNQCVPVCDARYIGIPTLNALSGYSGTIRYGISVINHDLHRMEKDHLISVQRIRTSSSTYGPRRTVQTAFIPHL